MKKTPGRPEAGAKQSLTRDLVLRAALAVLDEEGVPALSMRQLGTRLGVEAMSLYNHVASKDDLLDGALDLVVGEIAIPGPQDPWREAMRRRATSALEAFGRHPWAPALMDSRLSSHPARLRYFDTILGILLGAGFSLEQAGRAFSLLDSYVYGFGQQRANMAPPGEAEGMDKRAEAFRASMPAETFPHLERMAAWAMEAGYDEAGDFEFGLSLILDGLGRLLGPGKA